MAALKKIRNIFFVILVVGIVGYIFVEYYPYIFSRKVKGQISAVERIAPPVAIITKPQEEISSQVFSFAVGIRDEKSGEIVTASSEDRQWAIARAGLCVEAEFFPYPPWDLKKWGTYFNARLLKLYDCSNKPH